MATDDTSKDEPDVPEEFAAAWANVLLDLNEKRSQQMANDDAEAKPNKENSQCPSTSPAKLN